MRTSVYAYLMPSQCIELKAFGQPITVFVWFINSKLRKRNFVMPCCRFRQSSRTGKTEGFDSLAEFMYWVYDVLMCIGKSLSSDLWWKWSLQTNSVWMLPTFHICQSTKLLWMVDWWILSSTWVSHLKGNGNELPNVTCLSSFCVVLWVLIYWLKGRIKG